MPVIHDKVNPRERPKIAPREQPQARTSNRNLKREDSVERKPIISQEKPNTSRPVKTTKEKKTTLVSPRTEATRVRPRVVTKKTTNDKEKTDKISKPEKREKIAQKSVARSLQKEEGVKRINKLPTKPKISENKKDTVKSNIGKKESKTDITENNVNSKKRREPNHERTRTRTLSPSEITLAPKVSEAGPNEDTFGEAVAQNEDFNDKGIGENDDEKNSENSDEYENDFEDYESDFEDDASDELESRDDTAAIESKTPEIENESSTDEAFNTPIPDPITAVAMTRMDVGKEQEVEKKLDSGSYHITPQSRREIDEVKIAIQKENKQKRSAVKEIDEGYEDAPYKPLVKRSSSTILDFANAGKREKDQQTLANVKKRGEELSNMITLDAITYSILQIPPIPYDVFMKSFGTSNTSQAYAQTNEEDCDEEVQTETIEVANKWTQMPVEYTAVTNPDGRKHYEFTKEERVGAGSDSIPEAVDIVMTKPCNTALLRKFLDVAGQRISLWLERRSQRHLGSKERQISELDCCEGKFVFQPYKAEIKEGAAISLVAAASGKNNIILSVQNCVNKEAIINVWSISEFNTPLKILSCQQIVNCVAFGPGRGNLVFAGGADGSLNLWDLREGPELHQNEEKGYVRGATYSTAMISNNGGHVGPVQSIIVLRKDSDDSIEEFTPIQLCTMDETGLIILWSVVQQGLLEKKCANNDLGLAPWGRLRLVKASSFKVPDILPNSKDPSFIERYSAFGQDSLTGNGMYIATNAGRVIHCSTYGALLKPKCFVPDKNASPSAVNCLASYPYDDRYLLVGCSDGTIRLHSKNQENSLINLNANSTETLDGSGIRTLQWLPSRPCSFIALDVTSRIHIWNLEVSDIYPQYTILACNNKISCAIILKRKPTQTGCLFLGREDGSIELHTLKDEFRCKSRDAYRKERKLFQRYTSIL